MFQQIKCVLLIATLLLVSACAEQNGNAEYEYGIFLANGGTENPQENLAGKKSAIEAQLNVVATRDIPAELNTVFGVIYKFPADNYGKSVKVDGTIAFPAAGLTDPATGETTYESKYNAEVTVDENDPVDSLLFRLGQEWEIVPGTWKVTVRLDGKTFIQEEFNVVEQ